MASEYGPMHPLGCGLNQGQAQGVYSKQGIKITNNIKEHQK